MLSANETPPISSISVEALADCLANCPIGDVPEGVQLIDVREPHEVEIAALPGFVNLPLSESEQWMGSITDRFDPQTETIVLCHHGIRSAHMCQWLASQGFTHLRNVTGGIDAYAIVVDRSIARY
jgi:rhodanese-related sulfurtransferase